MYAEAVAQTLFKRKTSDAGKGFAGLFDGFNSSGNKRANVFAKMIVGEEVPLAIDIGEVIRIDPTLFSLFLAGFAIGEFELFLGGSRFCQCVKNFKGEDLLSARPKGNRLFDVSKA